MLEVLGRDYIRTAKAKGLPFKRVVIIHALKNMAIPLVTLFGLDFGNLLGGSIITETIFGWPGIGLLAMNAITMRDFPIVQTVVFYVAVGFVVVNLLVDVFYVLLDPRIRLGGQGGTVSEHIRSSSFLEYRDRTRWERAKRTLDNLVRSRLGLAGLIIMLIVIFSAIMADVIAPYDPNHQELTDRLIAPFSEEANAKGTCWERIIWAAISSAA